MKKFVFAAMLAGATTPALAHIHIFQYDNFTKCWCGAHKTLSAWLGGDVDHDSHEGHDH